MTVSASDRLPQALLAWEYGGGRTHLANLEAVARRLRDAGFACTAALADPRDAGAFRALGVPVVQTALWPLARRFAPHGVERSGHGFVDAMGNLGLGNAAWVEAVLAHYDGLFGLVRPDVVLAENAPGALLAARERLPAVAFGFASFLPAATGNRPARPAPQEGAWSEADLLPGLNAGLVPTGRTALRSLFDLFSDATVLPFGPAAFDPDGAARAEPPLPAHVPGYRPGMRAGPGGEEVFVYLGANGVSRPDVLAALLGLRRPIRALLPDADPADRALLERAGAAVVDAPLPIGEILAGSRCLLHHGGVGLAAAALAAGLPQVVLSGLPEQAAAGRFVVREGLGAHLPLRDVGASAIVEAVWQAYDDPALRVRCRERAPDFDGWFAFDPTERVAEAAIAAAEAGRRAVRPGPPDQRVP